MSTTGKTRTQKRQRTTSRPRAYDAFDSADGSLSRTSSSVRAILFRVDSPGGSAVASATIWREVLFERERGKPVIVGGHPRRGVVLAALALQFVVFLSCVSPAWWRGELR